jgi:arylsulfatase A-like enzyme
MKPLLLFLLLAGCTFGDKGVEPSPIIVLVSFDTTRVDALSAYGGDRAWTPNVDALARRGVRFDWALTPLPTTLGSHTSMMSGQDTHGHQVPRNGTPVPADVPLLAEKLEAAGWDRIAVIGAMPLQSSMGLNRGFRRYLDTELSLSPRRQANEVTDLALEAIDDRPGGQPIFLFVHYYDPHAPWTSAPQEIRDQFVRSNFQIPEKGEKSLKQLRAQERRGVLPGSRLVQSMRRLYLAQVSWTDQELGRLLDGLEKRGLMEDSFVIMTADHGEMMDESHLGQIYTHGPDVDLPVTHVPLIVAGQGAYQTPLGQEVSRRVRLQDIGNTILAQAGLVKNLGTGEDLAEVWSGTAGPPPPHFAEATRSGISPLKGKAGADEWANAHYERGVFGDEGVLIWTPWRKKSPKLYGFSVDQPRQTNSGARVRLKALLDAWDAGASAKEAAVLDAETEAALRALGYFD